MRDLLARWRFERGLRRLANCAEVVLRDYAGADWPDRGKPIADAPLLALDFELDGLNTDAHLLQAGWVAFSAASVPLENARVCDIRSHARLDREAVTIHGIGEDRAASGQALREVIEALVSNLSGHILVAHGADIEVAAIQSACHKLYGKAPPIRAICTLQLERHLKPNLGGTGPYRLGAARMRYGLPEYRAHDALSDAIASAELLLAQLAAMPDGTRLGRLEALSH